MRTDQLTGDHVLVTGAAQGVGRSVAETFRESGAEVTAVDRNDVVRELEAPAEPGRGVVDARVVYLGLRD